MSLGKYRFCALVGWVVAQVGWVVDFLGQFEGFQGRILQSIRIELYIHNYRCLQFQQLGIPFCLPIKALGLYRLLIKKQISLGGNTPWILFRQYVEEDSI